MKFLILWEFDVLGLRPDIIRAVLKMPDYAEGLRRQGKLAARYHVVGRHGGAWIYEVDSNEELERLLAMAPVYNFARYQVLPLAEMDTPAAVLRPDAGSPG